MPQKIFRAWDYCSIYVPVPINNIMQFDKDLQLIYITEVTKKDIMSGLGKMGNLYANIKEPADEFIINLSGDYDYNENVKIPEDATPIEWKNLPATIRLSIQFKRKLNTPPGLFYVADQGFFFYITDPAMKTLLREAVTGDFPGRGATTIMNALLYFRPYKEWANANFGEEDF
jgi:hypothetical protein